MAALPVAPLPRAHRCLALETPARRSDPAQPHRKAGPPTARLPLAQGQHRPHPSLHAVITGPKETKTKVFDTFVHISEAKVSGFVGTPTSPTAKRPSSRRCSEASAIWVAPRASSVPSLAGITPRQRQLVHSCRAEPAPRRRDHPPPRTATSHALRRLGRCAIHSRKTHQNQEESGCDSPPHRSSMPFSSTPPIGKKKAGTSRPAHAGWTIRARATA